MDVSVIYVDWNCAEEIEGSIESACRFISAVQYEIVVVNNSSPQGTGGLELDSRLRFIQNHENRGFGAGCNEGARHATGRYLLFLNPDTRFLNNVLGELVQFLDTHPEASIAGPLVENQDGKVLYEAGRSLPTLLTEFLEHSTLSTAFPKCPGLSLPMLSQWDHLSTREVESILGACMLIRSEVFRGVGGFDENFFLYTEELDLCYRIRKAGFRVWYVHSARLMHKERRSTLQMYGTVAKIGLQILHSNHYYFRKHYGEFTALLWRWMVAVLYYLRYLKGRDKAFLAFAKWAAAT